MAEQSTKEHWEEMYQKHGSAELSWYQETPLASLELMRVLNVPKDAAIIDVGGGDSVFVDALLAASYTDVTVLDISETSISRSRERLGHQADQVTWIVINVLLFKPVRQYALWHDRALLHFLREERDIQRYVEIVGRSVMHGGNLIIGTFSEIGPEKCSGLPVQRYSEEQLCTRFGPDFKKIRCLREEHKTPSQRIQNFVFCSFERK